MKDLGITKGDRWGVRKASHTGAHVVYLGDFKGDITFWHHQGSENEAIANAELTADAGNTAQKCGLLPSELLKQRDELLSVLQDIYDAQFNPKKTLANLNSIIANSIEAIEKATK